MNNSPEITTTGIVSVLSISPMEEDHFVLRDILNLLDGSLEPHRTFLLKSCANLSTALSVLRDRQFEVVVCERDLPPGSWKDVLEQVTILPDPPPLIVTSRLADERLWAEALNLGAAPRSSRPRAAGRWKRRPYPPRPSRSRTPLATRVGDVATPCFGAPADVAC